MNYYVTGFIGSDRIGCAQKLAAENGLTFMDMNSEIGRRDGRTVLRIVMSMGEHELHNKEYELLQWLGSPEAAAVSPSGFAVACGDGILFDSDCRELMEKGTVVIADPVASPSELWTAASADEGIPYAFMSLLQIRIRRALFCTSRKHPSACRQAPTYPSRASRSPGDPFS